MTYKIAPCFWFNRQAEEAANFYTSFFKGGKVTHTQHYIEGGKGDYGHEPDIVILVAFELNGGPKFQVSEAISFQIECDDQEEVDTTRK
jgi:predicted 3-demethylubiquinone-9 3-methyltransferase (glyoxalase superfamily)